MARKEDCYTCRYYSLDGYCNLLGEKVNPDSPSCND